MRGGSAGFTLMEIMVAVAILGSAVFVLLEAHYGAIQLFNKSEELVTLRELVSRAVGITQLDVLIGQTSGNGDFGERYPDYTYEYTVEDYSEDSDTLKVVQVVVAGPESEYTTSFLMYVASTSTSDEDSSGTTS